MLRRVSALFDDGRVDRRSGARHHLERRADKQERVLPVLGAVLRQVVQPVDFVEHHAQIAQQRRVRRVLARGGDIPLREVKVEVAVVWPEPNVAVPSKVEPL